MLHRKPALKRFSFSAEPGFISLNITDADLTAIDEALAILDGKQCSRCGGTLKIIAAPSEGSGQASSIPS